MWKYRVAARKMNQYPSHWISQHQRIGLVIFRPHVIYDVLNSSLLINVFKSFQVILWYGMCGIEELYSLGNSLIAMDTHKSKSEILTIIESISMLRPLDVGCRGVKLS